MCGVVAALGDWDITEPMRLLRHRGIRSNVMGCSAGVVGHVRLPIVGLGPEHDQPMGRGKWLIGFVGEILDFKEKSPGYECDAELVADDWEAMGPYGLCRYDGFWGIVAIDDGLEVLHVITDYLGQKPMYYRTDTPCAASEPNALLPFGPVTLDKVYLAACIKWGYCPDIARTPYNEVKHLRPGEHVVLANKMQPRCRIIDPLLPLQFQPKEMYNAIEAAVKRRVLSSDVQTACLVSGGLDSAIVYTMAKRYGNPVPYCATDDSDKDYWSALDMVRGPTKEFQAQDYDGMVPTTMLRKIHYADIHVDEALAVMQEPIDLGSLRPQIALAKAIDESVCLTGDGADELFGGYGRSLRYDSQYSDIFHELPAWHLPRLDRAMMINRVEVRSPFLARDVVRMALSLPHELRQDKNFLRSLARRDLPSRITDAEKKPLRTPEIAKDREYYSKVLVDKFVGAFYVRG